MGLQVGRANRRELDFARAGLEDVVERVRVFAISIAHQDRACQIVVVDVHLEVATLLRGPISSRILGARRDPDLPRTKVDEDHEVNVDKSLHRPFLFAGEVALPKRLRMALQKLVPSIRVVSRRRREARVNDHVLNRLPRNMNAHATQLLQDLRISPTARHLIRIRMTN